MGKSKLLRWNAEAYDAVADEFAAARTALVPREALSFDRFLNRLPGAPRVLDIGCGSGVPVTRLLVERGCFVHGIDASKRLIRHARSNVPEATFEVADMRTFAPVTIYDGIVAWDSLFFVDPERHAELFVRFAAWLSPGGYLLCSLGGTGETFEAPMFGRDFTFGALAPDASRGALEHAGFSIEHWEIDDPSSRGHLAVLARKGS